MQTNEVTYKVRLEAKETDCLGYTTLVFEKIDFLDLDEKYIMCVMFPNWNQSTIELDDIGFLSARYVKEGVDTWYDGKELIPYKYTNIIFLKFIKEQCKIELQNIILD